MEHFRDGGRTPSEELSLNEKGILREKSETMMHNVILNRDLERHLKFFSLRTEDLRNKKILEVGGGAANMLGRDPNGLANLFFRSLRSLAPQLPMLQRWQHPPAAEDSPPAQTTPADATLQVTEGQVAGHGVA